MIAYFDCLSGISGDMFLGALVDAGLAIEDLSAAIGKLGIEGLGLTAEKVTRLGMAATKVNVVAPHEHVHRNLKDIEKIIDASGLSGGVKSLAKRIFVRVAEAEAKVHNQPVEKVHFHEVGAIDSIADIVGAAAGLELLGIEKCYFSPIAVGSGTVKMAHGVLPVPAPATAELLSGIPVAESEEKGELATPTGVAIAGEISSGFGGIPAMTVRGNGSGAGTRQGEKTPNILRVIVGEASGDKTAKKVTVIEAAIDDMTGEALGYAREAIFAAGALDVYITAISMKKGRPAHLVTILTAETDKARVMDALFAETTTFGARVSEWKRETLDRRTVEVASELGSFRVKIGSRGGRDVSFAPEYEDVRRIAAERGLPFRRVYSLLAERAREEIEPQAGG